jgi:2Fe-2S ferredoxin
VRKTISLTVKAGENVHVLHSYIGEYRSLMSLIYDRLYVEEFGECKGVGRCGTCHVVLLNKPSLHGLSRNEETTLSKSGLFQEGSRLSCQVLIDESLDGIELEIVSENEPFKGY